MLRKVRVAKLPKMRMGNFGYNQISPSYIPDRLNEAPIESRSTLEGVDRDVANIEAEKGETVYMPDYGGLPAHFKIGGKRHSEGGTPLNVPDNSYVFSDTRSMTIKDKDILKFFGETKPKTPAQIAKKYDINKPREILANAHADKIQKETAESNISNSNYKLAQLALISESMKGFPQGIPDIAIPYFAVNMIEPESVLPIGMQQQGAMPPQMQEEMPMEMPMARMGGHLRRYQNTGQVTSDDLNLDMPRGTGRLPSKQAGRTGTTIWDKNYDSEWIPLVKEGLQDDAVVQKIITKLENYDRYGTGVKSNVRARLDRAQTFEDKKAIILDEATDRSVGPFHQIVLDVLSEPAAQQPAAEPVATTTETKDKEDYGDIEREDVDFTGDYTGSSRTPFFAQDMINLAGAMSDRASLRKYMPYLRTLQPVIPEPSYISPERELAALAEQSNIGQQAIGAFAGPQALSARQSSIFGDVAKGVADTLARYNTANIDIANTFESNKAATLNQYNQLNAASQQDYIDKLAIVNQQFDNSKRQANAEIRNQMNSAIRNRAAAQVLNELYPQFAIDPSSGGMLKFTRPKAMKPSSITEDPVISQIKELGELFPGTSPSELAKLALIINKADTKEADMYPDIAALLAAAGYNPDAIQ